jgi:hypothetical protein
MAHAPPLCYLSSLLSNLQGHAEGRVAQQSIAIIQPDRCKADEACRGLNAHNNTFRAPVPQRALPRSGKQPC